MPGSYGMYSTQQLPSLLSVHDILASEGPSIASPSPPVPAPLHKRQTRSEAENLNQNLLTLGFNLQLLLIQSNHKAQCCSPGLHCKLVGFVGDARLKSWTMYSHTCWVTALSHWHTEGALGNRGAVICNLNTVCAC